MNDLACDISHPPLGEPAQAARPELRTVKALAARPDIAAPCLAMVHDLLRAAEAHEEWIRQYLGIQAGNFAGA
jgi:hypothetical protein